MPSRSYSLSLRLKHSDCLQRLSNTTAASAPPICRCRGKVGSSATNQKHNNPAAVISFPSSLSRIGISTAKSRKDYSFQTNIKDERGFRSFHRSFVDDIQIMAPGGRATSSCGDGRGRGNSQSGGRGGRGRGGRSRGRGRGRGHHVQKSVTNNSGSNNKSNHNSNKRSIRIYTSNFDSFHKKCEAARYKVHKPNCNCNKVRQHILPRANEVVTFHIVDDEGAQNEDGFYAHDNDQQHIMNRDEAGQGNDDRIRRQQRQQIISIEEYVMVDPDLSRSGNNSNPKDGLVVVPDTKNVQAVYICTDTHEQIFHEDPFKAERKLKSEIFSFSTGSNNNNNNGNYAEGVRNDNQFKVSCASCLLEDEPNGFVCISSTNHEDMNYVRDMAREAAITKQQGGNGIETKLHADHAHYCITLPRSSLLRLARSRTRNQTSQARDELFDHMKAQGLPINVEASETPASSGSGGESGSNSVETDIDLQHHLKSSLNILTNDRNQEDEMFIFVIVYDDTASTTGKKPCWSFDLPGGKRHLAETAVEAAIRETEEECSLVWDKSWIRHTKQGTKESDRCNRFYFLSPPAALSVGT